MSKTKSIAPAVGGIQFWGYRYTECFRKQNKLKNIQDIYSRLSKIQQNFGQNKNFLLLLNIFLIKQPTYNNVFTQSYFATSAMTKISITIFETPSIFSNKCVQHVQMSLYKFSYRIHSKLKEKYNQPQHNLQQLMQQQISTKHIKRKTISQNFIFLQKFHISLKKFANIKLIFLAVPDQHHRLSNNQTSQFAENYDTRPECNQTSQCYTPPLCVIKNYLI
eukprot:TRINITY_DN5735_c0_g1_i3.p1 TRINITY_DN5735_c0_g1~~TRINITY_DN5735_c0_g1_i3.p1  ORF type:complete len:250 (+),score=-10.66 TRINITY_DN5735_c0_g1_i3:91-750(+)